MIQISDPSHEVYLTLHEDRYNILFSLTNQRETAYLHQHFLMLGIFGVIRLPA